MADDGGVPKRAIVRSAKLATLPIGVAGRVTLGMGKRLGGRPAEIVALEVQQRTAEQIFKVLGQLKGGAMKFGQALSVFEAALPEEVSAPYRQVLTKLQDSAPALPAASVHKVLASDLGADWRSRFTSFDDKPAAAASIGQVHPGTGAAGERGEHDTIVNAPLRAGDGGLAFREAIDGIILPRIEAYRPDLVILSAGFDAHRRDPLGGLDLDEDDFAWVTRRIMALAADCAGGRIVSLLEGGYDLEGLSLSVAAHVSALMEGVG